MRPRCTSLFRILFSFKPLDTVFLSSPSSKLRFCSTVDGATTVDPRDDALAVFRHWGCTRPDIHRLLTRCPKLHKAKVANLDSNLELLRGFGIKPSDLVTIIQRRPDFAFHRINRYFEKPLHRFESLFGSREMLIKAFVKNPSLLCYDFDNKIMPVVEMYAQLGIVNSDLVSLLLIRPALIPRSKLCEEKLDYIARTGVSPQSKMYKHVVATMATSRVETIREKLDHFQKYGFTEDEVLEAVGRSPYLLTLSSDKVQRNMTFIMGVIKLPAKVALSRPFLLFSSLEERLKPRMYLASKIDEMELSPRITGPLILTALKMLDERFIRAFISCHSPDVSKELMEVYRNAKGVKRLAVSSKKKTKKGFYC